ncbi:MAG: M48 family metalloprotease [Gammaproteobacteria bacterium]|nr:M48 family metalloprotease [Gammaproteobacteria bacterium]
MPNMRSFTRHLAIITGAVLAMSVGSARSDALPELGDASSAIVSPEMERRLGEMLLKQIRSSLPTVSDPILKYYTEIQLYHLAEHSQLKEVILNPILIDSPQLNAFAAPGGVVGINLGLYLKAEDIHEYSSVIGHELAHLSQRHFARGIEAQRRASLGQMVGFLGAVILAATAGSEAALAAASASQAIALDGQLRYSRGREQEADRIGMTTLVRAGLDPHGMGRMFERMQRSTRYSRRPPEFLLTHPVTESRISDARNHAAEYPRRPASESIEYQMMRARAQVYYADTPTRAVGLARDRLDEGEHARYALAIALSRAGEHDEALATMIPLYTKYPGSILIIASYAELLIDARRTREAIDILTHQLVINPDNQPFAMLYARALTAEKRYVDAEEVLWRQTVVHGNDVDIWFELAEISGLAGDTIGVHRSRAEFFALMGAYQNAIQHLEYARRLVEVDDFKMNAQLNARIQALRTEFEALKAS